MVVSRHLSALFERDAIWWIGATDGLLESTSEGTFVWLTDNSPINSTFHRLYPKGSKKAYGHKRENSSLTLWGQGQPDNWPNQVIYYA